MSGALFTCEVKFYLVCDFPEASTQPVLFVLRSVAELDEPEYEAEVRAGVYNEVHNCILEGGQTRGSFTHEMDEVRFMAKMPDVPQKYKSGVGP